MDRWDELRTALFVHELGTVSAAADALGVHRATVIRHIDTLEDELGVPMFRRHAQGYTATDACSEALVAVKQAERLIAVASGKVRGVQPTFEKAAITVSINAGHMPLIALGVTEFLRSNPEVRVHIHSSDRIVHLDSGEADLAIRVGKRPTERGVLVEPFTSHAIGLYATDDYLKQRGPWTGPEDLGDHLVVGPAPRKQMPFASWARRNIPSDNFRLSVECGEVALSIALAGTAIGLLPDYISTQNPQLKRLHTLPQEFDETLWFATPTNGNHPELVHDLVSEIRRGEKGIPAA
ncbi:MAG: LysR family transcriptional regulator [Pseudomonadota bacterium]